LSDALLVLLADAELLSAMDVVDAKWNQRYGIVMQIEAGSDTSIHKGLT